MVMYEIWSLGHKPFAKTTGDKVRIHKYNNMHIRRMNVTHEHDKAHVKGSTLKIYIKGA